MPPVSSFGADRAPLAEQRRVSLEFLLTWPGQNWRSLLPLVGAGQQPLLEIGVRAQNFGEFAMRQLFGENQALP